MEIRYNILDKKRLSLLPLLKFTKNRFYLAGGTALALYHGHRQSIDFDFFSENKFNNENLKIEIKEIFKDNKIEIIQEEAGTISIIIDESVKISFFYYPYKLLREKVELENLDLASEIDIACMKFSAICGRSSKKDYIDLFFLLQKYSLKELLSYKDEKFPELDTNVVLKSLNYFGDIDDEPIIFEKGFEISFEKVTSFLEKKVLDFYI